MGANVLGPDMSSFEFLICFLSAHLYICIFFVSSACRLAKLGSGLGFCSFLGYRCFALIETISSIVSLINLWPLQYNPNAFRLRFRCSRSVEVAMREVYRKRYQFWDIWSHYLTLDKIKNCSELDHSKGVDIPGDQC